MKKEENRSPDLIEVKPHITEVLNDHPLIHWIVDNRKMLLAIFGAAILSAIVITRFSMGAPGQKEANLITAESEFINFQRVILGINTEMTVEDAYKKVNDLLSQYPELNSKYDAPLAQAFLTIGNPQDAKKFADEALKRTRKNDLPLYQDFAKTSLLISEGNYKEAIVEAQQLKEKLKPDSILYAYNLLRIATLNKTLGNKQEELDAWKEWNKSQNTSIIQLLEQGNILITDYISQREKDLQS